MITNSIPGWPAPEDRGHTFQQMNSDFHPERLKLRSPFQDGTPDLPGQSARQPSSLSLPPLAMPSTSSLAQGDSGAPILFFSLSEELKEDIFILSHNCSLCYYKGKPYHHSLWGCPCNNKAQLATRHDEDWVAFKGHIHTEKENVLCFGCFIPLGVSIPIYRLSFLYIC